MPGISPLSSTPNPSGSRLCRVRPILRRRVPRNRNESGTAEVIWLCLLDPGGKGFLFDKTPGLRNISSGFRIIIITLIIAGIAAYFFPVKEDEYDELEEAGELSDSTKEAHHES